MMMEYVRYSPNMSVLPIARKEALIPTRTKNSIAFTITLSKLDIAWLMHTNANHIRAFQYLVFSA
jgi:hypothetical protein